MKYNHSILGLLLLLAVSCSFNEIALPEENVDSSADVVFYATIDEQPDADTKVYADDQLRVLWNADDRITIFNKYTYGYEYYFKGEDGDTAGAFGKVPNDDFVSGNTLDLVYAVYPHSNETKIDNDGIITLTLPAEQTYKDSSFGIGANTMVSKTTDNQLRFKNVGGYLSLKFFGEGVSISSITLKGNNGEFLAGKCSIDMSSGLPVLTMDEGNASETVTLTCDPAVDLGNSSSEAIAFWFVLPPVTLTEGFTVTVTTPEGAVFEKSSSNKYEIGRSAITKLGAMEVVPVFSGNIVFADPEVKRICVENWDTDGNGDLSYEEAAAVTDLNQCFKNNTIITSFDELQYFTGLTYIGKKETYSNGYSILSSDFWGCTNLSSVVLPETVKEIGVGAFAGCESLSSIEIPASVSSIYNNAFGGTGLTSITFPEGSSINFHEGAFVLCMSLSTVRFEGAISSYGVEAGVFEGCPITDLYFGKEFNYLGIIGSPYSGPNNLYYQLFMYYGNDLLDICTIEVSDQNSKYDSRDNCNALIETATNSLILGCKNTTIPESVTCIASGSLTDIDPLTSFIVPATVTSIGGAFDPRLESITLESMTPPILIDDNLFGYNWDNDDTPTIIYVPTESLNAYKTADGWSRYADRIQAIPTPNNIIYYTSTDGNIVTPHATNVFGANIVSNEYVAGQGVLSFDGDVKRIGDGAFSGCRTLKSISIPDSVTEIGFGVFNDTVLSDLRIPKSVTQIDPMCIVDAYDPINTISVDPLNPIFDSRNECNAVIETATNRLVIGTFSTRIPNTVAIIGACAFYRCIYLTQDVSLPESITTIEGSAFYDSGLYSITIPDSVTQVGEFAFNRCRQMRLITVYSTIPPTGGLGMFDDTNNSPIYVPAESVEAYKAAEYWSDYADRIQAIPE